MQRNMEGGKNGLRRIPSCFTKRLNLKLMGEQKQQINSSLK